MIPPTSKLRFLLATTAILFIAACPRTFALQPEDIAMIVNTRQPAGRDLAQFYAQARHIPDNRILELDLPTTEEMPFKDYERNVVPQIREFLRTSGSDQPIKCFVTFYGVPLRIAARVRNTPDENRELDDLRQQLLRTADASAAPVAALEKLAIQINPKFVPAIGTAQDHLALRATEAERDILAQIHASTVPADRLKMGIQLFAALEPLAGDGMKLKQMALEQALNPTTQPSGDTALLAAKNAYDRMTQSAAELEQQRYDAKARGELRQLYSKHLGLFGYFKLLRDQTDYLATTDTAAAFDSELSLVRWTAYPRTRWIDNPLFYAARKTPGTLPPMYMVMRLDAPKSETVKDIITASVQAELHGLEGKVVLDSRGLTPGLGKAPERGLAEYDQTIRNLADFIRQHTKLEMLDDDKPEVLPAHSADNVALYCGWYSLRNYVPSCSFKPGAVGFHIASYELISLHNPGETGWVAGLLNSGVAATIGPVAEPYVQAFPRPDDFFPLLLTGKMTLAEVYWRTTPMTSWMLCAIGDPLYNPYKTNPALDAKDLPPRLKSLFTAVPATGQ